MSRLYIPTWITDQLAVGAAPMSHAQLDSLREDGIAAILNLCGEFCDLHDIECAAGFEVYHMPLADEEAPELAELEKALAWLDEAIYLGKKVLIHCRHGIGRTGTVLNAYLLRRGLGHRQAWLKLFPLRSKPTNFAQWWTVRKYGRRSPKLTVREPSLEMRKAVDLGPLFREYEALLEYVDASSGVNSAQCGREHALCCRTPVSATLMEAAYLTHAMNTRLTSTARLAVIERAVEAARHIRTLAAVPYSGENCVSDTTILCPLHSEGQCLVFSARPLQCRTFALDGDGAAALWSTSIMPELQRLALELWYEFSGNIAQIDLPKFILPDVVSGKYIQALFHLMLEK